MFGYVPVAVEHSPERRRLPVGQWRAEASSPYPVEILLILINAAPSPICGSSTLERLRYLGRWLEATAAAPAADFEETVRKALWRSKSWLIDHLERLLERHSGEPKFWAEDVRRYVGVLSNRFAAPHSWVPRELQRGRTLSEARDLIQRIVRRYGALLAAWPDVWTATKRVVDRHGPVGTRIGRR
jgi:hypothetical protein